jgi:hypothetical protein
MSRASQLFALLLAIQGKNRVARETGRIPLCQFRNSISLLCAELLLFVIVRVDATEVAPVDGLRVDGLKLAVALAGKPETEKVMALVSDTPEKLRVTPKLALPPEGMLVVVAELPEGAEIVRTTPPTVIVVALEALVANRLSPV